jgi:serine phosphatase RsbU (regulator of sigma subunit)
VFLNGEDATGDSRAQVRAPMKRLLSWVSIAVLVVLVAMTAVTTWIVHNTVSDQESRLLRERTNEVGLVLSTALSSLSDQLTAFGSLLRSTDNSVVAFDRATDSTVSGDSRTAIALLRKTPSGYRVVIANGAGLTAGSVIDDQRVAALDRAMTATKMVPTEVAGAGAHRTLGFAVGPPATPAGTLVYRQTSLGALGPPRLANTAPFSEVEVTLYDGMSPSPGQAIVTTADHLPMTGQLHSTTLSVGAATWLLEVRAVHPLVGGTTANAQWFVLAFGLLLCMLVTTTAEIESRRRANAEALYTNEQRLAEGLQRSLLPELPTVAGLDVAARYLPGTAGQQVGGDWYDVFPLDGGRVGIVIGDVVGHDISASAMMSRVQAALRAYAFRNDDPATVLDRLDTLIETFRGDRLVTIFYGILSAPDDRGNRRLQFANAGHPPPIACRADGGVDELAGGASILLGAAALGEGNRATATVELVTGSTLVLYTDGLIEVPGESLTDSIERLKHAAVGGAALTPDQLCDRLADQLPAAQQRDDVAILAVRLSEPTGATRQRYPAQAVQRESDG